MPPKKKKNSLPSPAAHAELTKFRLEDNALRARKRPGPTAADAPSAPEQDLKDSLVILRLIEEGKLKKYTPNTPSDKAQDRLGHPKKERLTQKEENILVKRVQFFGDTDARNTLVMANMGLVHLVANQFNRPYLRYEDLLQEGTMGLMRATESFEPEKGVRFSTYSVYWIRAKIQRLLQKIDKDDIPTISGAPIFEDNTGKKHKARAHKISIDRNNEEDDSRALSDVIAANTDDPERVALSLERQCNIKAILDGIVEELGDPRLKHIIEWRLLADEPETLASIGERLDLSREGARLLEAKMLRLAKSRLAGWRREV